MLRNDIEFHTLKTSYDKQNNSVVCLRRDKKTGMFFLEVSTSTDHYRFKFTQDPLKALDNFTDITTKGENYARISNGKGESSP